MGDESLKQEKESKDPKAETPKALT